MIKSRRSSKTNEHPPAVAEASAAHVRRLGQPPTHVILPLGEYAPEVGGLKVETSVTVDTNHMKVYAMDGEK